VRPTRYAPRLESNGDASACRGIRARKLLFGNEIANQPARQRHAPSCAMTSSMFDVTELTAPPPRCGTYDLVTHVRRLRALVSSEIHRHPWPVAIRADDRSYT
jgi:hypothetical protein